MGARANYVLVHDAGWDLHYSHWGASDIAAHLLAGPAHAVRFIAAQGTVDRQTGWLDDVWAEGGALVDTVRARLLFFTRHDPLARVPARRACSAVMARTWPGWSVSWAHDGLADLAASVGVDPARVRVPQDRRDSSGIRHPDDRDVQHGCYGLLSVRDEGGRTRGWLLDTEIGGPVATVGEDLLARLPDLRPAPAVLAGWPPEQGLHVDLRARRVGWWTVCVPPGLVEDAADGWPGWHVEFWGDRCEQHRRECAGGVRAPEVDGAQGLDELVAHLAVRRPDPVASALDTVEVGPTDAERRGLDAAVAAVAAAVGRGDEPG